MQLRSALPVSLLLGSAIGAAMAGVGSPTASRLGHGLNLIAEAEGATGATWDIPMVRNASVDRFVDMFQGKQQDRMALYLKRSGRYEGMIRAKLRARGMPEDLLYLSMIESGFNPTARSHAEAVGLWQFMDGTARGYGLRVDGWVDERRDPEKSTDAALRYLRDLHSTFGSWYLAAAAYNSGENRVKRVMKEETGSEKGDETSFWRIRFRLPAETREYVPLLLAAALVGKEPGKYGLGEVPRWLPLETDTVQVPGEVSLNAVAQAAGVSGEALAKLNPALVRKATPPGKKLFSVLIPQGHTEQFAAAFPEVYVKEQVRIAAEQARQREIARQARIEREAKERAARRAAAAAARRH
ncbi:MAG: Membrane-bound lytic murein transglycosylase, partial [Gemmatimonadetes bacterium]|nr:Membrane-bound lytic murein transglycosylase [Gemmatimonadota bacterium]